MEPRFVSQGVTKAGMDGALAEARAAGCVWCRVTTDEVRGLWLVEAWMVRPASEGERRWLLSGETEAA